MSGCIKDLYDYELVKKCSRCVIISLKSNFHRQSKSKNGLQPQCKRCLKLHRGKYYEKNYGLEKNID